MRRTQRIWIVGFADYVDQFADGHRVGYARVFEPPSGMPAPRKRNNLVFPQIAGYNYDRETKG